jgi:hypothetical protein
MEPSKSNRVNQLFFGNGRKNNSRKSAHKMEFLEGNTLVQSSKLISPINARLPSEKRLNAMKCYGALQYRGFRLKLENRKRMTRCKLGFLVRGSMKIILQICP